MKPNLEIKCVTSMEKTALEVRNQPPPWYYGILKSNRLTSCLDKIEVYHII